MQINIVDKNHILYAERSNNSDYYRGFLETLEVIDKHIKSKKIRNDIINNKLQIKRDKFCYKQYIQSATEISVLRYFLMKHTDTCIYEPCLNNSNKNVECSFTISGYQFNIEVKTPTFTTLEEQKKQDTFKIKSSGRFEDYKPLSKELKQMFTKTAVDEKRMDLNAFDYLKDANSKFPIENESNNLNVLYIALNDPDTIQDWYDYFTNIGGFFQNDSFKNPDLYNRVDIVILCNLYFKHNVKVQHADNPWCIEKCFNLMIPNKLSHYQKYEAKQLSYKLFPNYTKEYIQYLNEKNPPIMPLKHFIFERLQKILEWNIF